jgi:hypothetical protein
MAEMNERLQSQDWRIGLPASSHDSAVDERSATCAIGLVASESGIHRRTATRARWERRKNENNER